MGILIAILQPLLLKLIESWFSEPKAQANAKSQLTQVLDAAVKIHEQSQQTKTQVNLVDAQSAVILADKNGNTLQRDWIPILMYLCMCIMALSLIVVPILHYFDNGIGTMAIPEQVWSLMQICMGGCVGVHGLNKVADTVFNNDKFFNSLRKRMGGMTQQQVDAYNAAIKDAQSE